LVRVGAQDEVPTYNPKVGANLSSDPITRHLGQFVARSVAAASRIPEDVQEDQTRSRTLLGNRKPPWCRFAGIRRAISPFHAFQKVKETLPDAELICVGGLRPDFVNEMKKWKGTFSHYESVSHPELAKILAESTAFVLPSLEEGFAR
jgi:hypothetical protein